MINTHPLHASASREMLQDVIYLNSESTLNSTEIEMTLQHNHPRKTQWVPSLNPQRWLVMNVILVWFSSIILIIEIENPGENGLSLAAESYIIYNFGTTIIWCFEAGFESWWSIRTRTMSQKDLFTWKVFFIVAEVVVAVFFLVDSCVLFWKWKIVGFDIVSSSYDILANLIFYLYAMTRDCVRINQQRTDLENQQLNEIRQEFTEVL